MKLRNIFFVPAWSAVVVTGLVQTASAAPFYWDTSTAANVQAGSGAWGTDSFWTQNGTTLSAWTSGGTAVFSGNDAVPSNTVLTNAGSDGTYNAGSSSYLVAVGSGLTAANLVFNNTGFYLSSAVANTLTLSINNSTGGVPTATNAALWVANGKTSGIGSNLTLALTATGFGSRIGLDNGATLNVESGGKIDKTAGANRDLVFTTTTGSTATINVNSGGTITRSVASDTGEIVIGGTNGGASGTVIMNVAGTLSTAGTGASNGQGSIALGIVSGLTGTLNINSGGIVTASDANTADAQAGIKVGAASGAIGNVNLNSGGALTTQKVFMTAGATGTFNFNGGTLKANATTASFMNGLTNAYVKSGGAIVDSNGFNVTIAQNLLTDPVSTGGGLTKQGNGTLTLSGTGNTYTGATAVNVGTLNVTGALTSAISVANGATLSGTGSTTSSLTMNSGSTLSVDTVTEFTANGVNFAGSTQLAFNGSLSSGSTYDVITYGAGGLTNLGNLVQTNRGSLGQDVINNKVTFTAGGVLTDTWTSASGTWVAGTGGAGNWSNGSDNLFWNGDTAIFDDTPGVNSTASVSGTVVPAAVNVSGATNHLINGAGVIAGTGALTKSGAGTLTIQTANTYSGGTTVNAGTLLVNNGGTLSTGAVTINAGTLQVGDGTTDGSIASTSGITNTGSLVYNLTGGQSYANAITGSGSVTKTGAGTLTFTGGNTYSGGTTINGGKLVATTNGLNGGAISIGSGGTLTFTGSNQISTSTITGSGAILNDTANTMIFTGDQTGFTGSFTHNAASNNTQFNSAVSASENASYTLVAGELIFATSGDYTVKFGSLASVAGNIRGGNSASGTTTLEVGHLGTDTSIAGNLNNGTLKVIALTKVGTGALTLAGTSTYSGGTVVSGGKLNLTNVTGSATGTGAVALSGGTTTTLSGTGFSTGALTVTNGSRLAPGVNISGTNNNFGAAGTLTVGSTGGITLTSAHIDFDLSSNAASGNDLIATGGTLALSASVSFTFSSLNGTLDTTTAYTLISGATGNSGFNATALAANTTFTGFSGIYIPTYAMNGNDLTVSFVAVPEPHEWGMILGGMLAGMAILRRRKMAKV